MTDALKRARVQIARICHGNHTEDMLRCPNCDPTHAALDAAVEEAMGTIRVTLSDQKVREALAAERERGRREALDLLHAPDACPGCAHVLALLKEPAPFDPHPYHESPKCVSPAHQCYPDGLKEPAQGEAFDAADEVGEGVNYGCDDDE